MTSLSIISVNFKTDKLVLDLLGELEPYKGVEIIIVDNSPVNTLEEILPKRKDLSYFFTGKNLGFSGGNNFGIKRAKGEWLLLLNSDALVSTSELLKLLEVTRKENYLVSAPRLIQPDGKIQNNIGCFDSFGKNPVSHIFARPRFLNCSKIKENTKCDLLTGAAMLIHRSLLDKVGLLDDKNYFMYFEDIDFSYRLYRAGVKVLYVPGIKVIHLGGASSDQDSRQKNVNYQRGLKSYLIKNRGILVYYLNKIIGLFK